jgi:hypothetical protein
MDYKLIINSVGMWVVSGVMVVVVLVQSLLFLRAAFNQGKKIGMPRERLVKGFRAAAITTIGPSLGPIVVLIALVAVLGAPTTWMRLNDIGAARTELAMASLATKVSGQDLRAPNFDLQGFSYVLWGMALNNVGWLMFALFFTHRMGWAVKRLGEKFDPRWIKYLMAAAAIGLFSYLLTSTTIGTKTIKPANIYAAVVSVLTMVLISKGVKKYPVLLEPAFGIAIIVGMLTAAYLD